MHEGVVHIPLLFSRDVLAGEYALPVRSAASAPTLLATRLQLELLLGERAADLRAAAGILLNDVGATLAIFARTSDETGGALPERFEDCLACLGTDAWLEAVSGDAVERTDNVTSLHAFWERARRLAYAAWLIASAREGICPEQAYLVGLLYEIRKLPALLGRPEPDAALRQRRAAVGPVAVDVSRAKPAWPLPAFLEGVLGGDRMPEPWRALLAAAHAWSRGDEVALPFTA